MKASICRQKKAIREKKIKHPCHGKSLPQESCFFLSESKKTGSTYHSSLDSDSEISLTHFNIQQNISWNEGYLSRELNASEMEKVVHKIRHKSCLSTAVDSDMNRHHAHVCVICDCHIIGLEEVKFIKKETLLESSSKFAVSAYEEYYDGVSMHPELVKQYQVDDCNLKHLLLLPRAHLDPKDNKCCETCYGSLKSSRSNGEDKPPKFAIANGFAVGHVPDVIHFHDKNGNVENRRIDAEIDWDDLICTSIGPVRPFGYVHAYTGGSQKSVKGHFSIF
jgi:hypothetical protein